MRVTGIPSDPFDHRKGMRSLAYRLQEARQPLVYRILVEEIDPRYAAAFVEERRVSLSAGVSARIGRRSRRYS